ncbi:MAG: hypothetical protein IJT41_11220 [Clostridia bacterium]|nr:hypothetical protein [Clostridia bacterium]
MIQCLLEGAATCRLSVLCDAERAGGHAAPANDTYRRIDRARDDVGIVPYGKRNGGRVGNATMRFATAYFVKPVGAATCRPDFTAQCRELRADTIRPCVAPSARTSTIYHLISTV